jgi:hypothetical protein
MNQQEATKAGSLSVLRAGRTVKEIMSYGISEKKLFKMKNIEVRRMCCFWRICWYIYESKISGYEGTVLAATLEELITRATSRLMRSLSQEINISRTTVGKMVSEDGPDIWKSPLHLPAWTVTLPTTTRGSRIGSRRASREVRKKEISPSSSPHCNSFNYFAGGVSEFWVRANPPTKPETWSPKSGR